MVISTSSLFSSEGPIWSLTSPVHFFISDVVVFMFKFLIWAFICISMFQLNYLNIWNTVIMTFWKSLSSNSNICVNFGSVLIEFSSHYVWAMFFFFFFMLVIIYWILGIMNFTFLGIRYFCISIDILVIYLGTQFFGNHLIISSLSFNPRYAIPEPWLV